MGGFAPPQDSMGPKVKGYADVIFVMDTTASMQKIIDGVKDNVHKFVEGLQSNPNQSVDWNVWVVGFRDVEADGPENAFINLDKGFVSSVEEVRAQLDALEAQGGGDEPESLLDVLHKIAQANKWPRSEKESQRVIAVFTDAPPKKEMHPAIASGHQDYNTVVKELSAQHVKMFLYGPSDDEVLQGLLGTHSTKSVYVGMGNTYDEVTAKMTTVGFDKLLLQMGSTLSGVGAVNVKDAGSGTQTKV